MKEKKRLNEFLQLAKNHHLTIAESDLWNNDYCIGLDATAKQLFFLKKQDDKEETCIIDLAKIKKCQAKNITKSVKTKGGTHTVTDRLELVFTPKDLKAHDQAIAFYNREESLGITSELPLLTKWEKRINDLLK
ncbi:MAG: hypothetical protein DHS20C18_08270 [Saprospiraceae bacterium]|nr:MAG: hypothetical protein DHS20C18_08270 [Saprospiraceae bacterium]